MCRPACLMNDDCPKSKACVNNKCVDPCPGVCGIHAECQVVNHAPMCSCINGYIGNPFEICRPKRKNHQINSLSRCLLIFFIIWFSFG